jgi:hypothetical protein
MSKGAEMLIHLRNEGGWPDELLRLIASYLIAGLPFPDPQG